jgi:hypothetical protein
MTLVGWAQAGQCGEEGAIGMESKDASNIFLFFLIRHVIQ